MSSRDSVVVVGASGFGRETLDTLEAMQRAGNAIDIVGVVDDSPSVENLARLRARNTKYLGNIGEWLASGPRSKFVLAVGSPAIRRELVQQMEARGLRALSAIHPSVTFGASCSLSEGVVISAGAIISTNVSLGRHVHVNPGAIIGHDTVVEEFVSINPGAVVSGDVTLQSGVLVGASATVLQQLTVGNRSVIGAGSLVTKDAPEGVVVVGVPGRW